MVRTSCCSYFTATLQPHTSYRYGLPVPASSLRRDERSLSRQDGLRFYNIHFYIFFYKITERFVKKWYNTYAIRKPTICCWVFRVVQIIRFVMSFLVGFLIVKNSMKKGGECYGYHVFYHCNFECGNVIACIYELQEQKRCGSSSCLPG